jgi:hypothetical protein
MLPWACQKVLSFNRIHQLELQDVLFRRVFRRITTPYIYKTTDGGATWTQIIPRYADSHLPTVGWDASLPTPTPVRRQRVQSGYRLDGQGQA